MRSLCSLSGTCNHGAAAHKHIINITTEIRAREKFRVSRLKIHHPNETTSAGHKKGLYGIKQSSGKSHFYEGYQFFVTSSARELSTKRRSGVVFT